MRKSQNIRLQSAVAALAHRRRRYGEKPPDRFNRILRLILSALYFLPLGIAEYALAAWIVEISNSYTQGAENAKENHGHNPPPNFAEAGFSVFQRCLFGLVTIFPLQRGPIGQIST